MSAAAIDGKSDALFWREFGMVLALLFAFFIGIASNVTAKAKSLPLP